MTRPFHRGSSAGQFHESSWSNGDTPLQIQVNGMDGESSKSYGENSMMSTGSLRLLMKQANREYSAGSFRSPQKSYQMSGENGFKYSPRATDNSLSSDLHSLKSSYGSPSKDRSYLVQTLEIRSLGSPSKFPSSPLFASSSLLRSRRVLAGPLAKCVMLCFVSIFVLITMLGSSIPGDYISVIPKLGIFKTYRPLQQGSLLDFSNGGIFGLGTVMAKDLGTCAREMENYVPCYNVSASLRAGFKNGEEYDRHCALNGKEVHCLIRPPSEYRIPLKWPASRDGIWSGNVKVTSEQLLDTGTGTKRLLLVEENLITFHSRDAKTKDMVENYSQQLVTMIGLHNDTTLNLAGVKTILDIGCGLYSSGAHLLSKNMLTLCLAPYEAHGSQVQLALERGLPAMIGSLITRQVPFPRLSFDMIKCADCGVDWNQKDGALILEIDRLLKQGGYFVWTSPFPNPDENLLSVKDKKKWKAVEFLARRLCWDLLTQQGQTIVWRKTADLNCFISRGPNARPHVCESGGDVNNFWNQPLRSCISAAPSGTSTSVKPDALELSSIALVNNGLSKEALLGDLLVWSVTVKDYWSLLSPLIFSDHPKRPGEEDPLPPSNMVRNVMDMNAMYGSLNSALLQAGKSVWVMNVVPISGPNTLSVIYNRGHIGTLHDWCEAFPTYPRTYDLLHGAGLLSQEAERPNGCGLSNLFIEMDRILRPEGWIFLRDKKQLIEDARVAAAQMRWEARVIEVDGDSDLRLLVCQKNFWKS